MDQVSRPAELHYTISDFAVVTPGAYVICAVTGTKIPLDRLKYWSAELQEAYVNAEASTRRFEDLKATDEEK